MPRILLFIIFTLLSHLASAQAFRYYEKVFSEIDTFANLEYARTDWLNNHISLAGELQIHAGETQTENRGLFMDIFVPKNDTIKKRPTIIFAHSGGFLAGTRHNDDMLAMCDSFAQKGYVTATIDYRLGLACSVTTFLGIILHAQFDPKNGYRTVYRATQDSRAAIRFLKHNAELYGIDTTKMYMVGSSAGAFVALHNLFLDKPEEIPSEIFNEPSLGPLDTVGIQGYGSQLNAAVSMWGALHQTQLIEDNKTPLLLIHGEADETVYFKKGVPLKTFVPDLPAISYNISATYGSFCIDTAFQNRGIFQETYFVPGQKHSFYGVNTGNFTENGPNAYWDTVQWKINNFLFEQFKPEAKFQAQTNEYQIELTDTSQDAYYSEWNLGDGNNLEGRHVFHTFSDTGKFVIRLKTCLENRACDTVSKVVLIKTVQDSIPLSTEMFSDLKVEIYPNPASNEIHIKGITTKYKACIYSLSGEKIIDFGETNSSTLPISALKNGIYFLKIETERNTVSKLIVKNNR